jgi:[ribosomal protein S18]-alanine N-acetyltransferase
MATAQAEIRTDHSFRPMTEADLSRVQELETAAYAFPWSEQIFRDCLRVGYHCVAIDTPAGVQGYGIMSMGAGESHVLNVCVAEAWRGRGIGRRLMETLLERVRNAGMELAFLEVRPSNRAAIALYESMGFDRVGMRKGYYQSASGREDAFVYRLHLAPPPS